ncbi:Alpha-L-fucosidase [Bertholletia excelsa]
MSLLALFACIFLSLLPTPALSLCHKPPVIFNFGDSNSDTGGIVAGLGSSYVRSPNGRTFFGYPAGRVCDGRLVIDFLCESVNTSLLNPYLDSVGTTFTNGANFAISGSKTLPDYLPFALHIQVMQFLRLKARSLQLVAAGVGNLIDDQAFRDALYMIDIGQNDLAASFSYNVPYVEIINLIPSVMTQIKNAVKDLYDQGGRKFWIHNTGPLGCLPEKLSMAKHDSMDLDPHGCVSSYNVAAQVFNKKLRRVCREMRSEMKDATIVYVDMYAIKYDLIANFKNYGFSSAFMSCCGYGGPPYNYNGTVPCGNPMSEVCDEGSKYISWDGIHYTEAANAIVASKILSGAYSTPPTPFDFFCRA